MARSHTLQALSIVLLAAGGTLITACNDEEKNEAPKGLDDATIADVKKAVATMSAYLPHIEAPKDVPYEPKKTDLDRATVFAANEIRHAGNAMRQQLQKVGSDAAEALAKPATAVTSACADVKDAAALDGCRKAVDELNTALGSVSGATLPKIEAGSVTDEAKTAQELFLKAKGPTTQESDYVKKRADKAAAIGEVVSACNAAAAELEGIATSLEKAPEAIHLIAVTRHQSFQAGCIRLGRGQQVLAELEPCEKDASTTECKATCAQAKAMLERTLDAAALEVLKDRVPEICKDE